MMDNLPAVLDALVAHLADAVVAKLHDRLAERQASPAASGFVDRRGSGLDGATFKRAAKLGRAGGGFDTFRVGRRVMARRADVNAFIERHPVASSPPSDGSKAEKPGALDALERAILQGVLRPLASRRTPRR